METQKKYRVPVVRYLLLLVTLNLVCYNSGAQGQGPVSWRFNAKKIGDRKYELHLRATIQEPWHIYAQDIPEGAALPTTIAFDKNPLLELQGAAKEVGDKQQKTEEGMLLKYYSRQVEFVQVVTLKADIKTTIRGSINFMVCTDERCLPPSDRNFSITLDGRK